MFVAYIQRPMFLHPNALMFILLLALARLPGLECGSQSDQNGGQQPPYSTNAGYFPPPQFDPANYGGNHLGAPPPPSFSHHPPQSYGYPQQQQSFAPQQQQFAYGAPPQHQQAYHPSHPHAQSQYGGGYVPPPQQSQYQPPHQFNGQQPLNYYPQANNFQFAPQQSAAQPNYGMVPLDDEEQQQQQQNRHIPTVKGLNDAAMLLDVFTQEYGYNTGGGDQLDEAKWNRFVLALQSRLLARQRVGLLEMSIRQNLVPITYVDQLWKNAMQLTWQIGGGNNNMSNDMTAVEAHQQLFTLVDIIARNRNVPITGNGMPPNQFPPANGAQMPMVPPPFQSVGLPPVAPLAISQEQQIAGIVAENRRKLDTRTHWNRPYSDGKTTPAAMEAMARNLLAGKDLTDLEEKNLMAASMNQQMPYNITPANFQVSTTTTGYSNNNRRNYGSNYYYGSSKNYEQAWAFVALISQVYTSSGVGLSSRAAMLGHEHIDGIFAAENVHNLIGRLQNRQTDASYMLDGEAKQTTLQNPSNALGFLRVLREQSEAAIDVLKYSLGILEYRLRFDVRTEMLSITVIRAENLPAMDSNGLSDPYVSVHLISTGGVDKTHGRTEAVQKTLNPVFNMKKPVNVPIQYYGTLLFTLHYDEHAQKLSITSIAGRRLKSTDTNGLSDPYVFVTYKMKPKPMADGRRRSSLFNKTRTRKTRVVKRNLNPMFKDELVFDKVTAADLPFVVLSLDVYDWDQWSKDDIIGRQQVDFGYMNVEALKQGSDMPNQLELTRDEKPGFGSIVRLTVWDQDLATRNDRIGQVDVRLADVKDILLNGHELHWLSGIEPKPKDIERAFRQRGQIQYRIWYDAIEEEVHVSDIAVQEIPKMDYTGHADPFVKVRLMPDGIEYQTNVVKKVSSATYKSHFVFPIHPFGKLKYSVHYDAYANKLIVKIISARKLPIMDGILIGTRRFGSGKADPYVRIEMHPDLFGINKDKNGRNDNMQYQTGVVQNELNPVFDDVPYEIVLRDIVNKETGKLQTGLDALYDAVLTLSVWDWDKGSQDDLIGQVYVPFAAIIDSHLRAGHVFAAETPIMRQGKFNTDPPSLANKELQFRVFDWDMTSKNDLIGQVSVSFAQLLDDPAQLAQLMDPKQGIRQQQQLRPEKDRLNMHIELQQLVEAHRNWLLAHEMHRRIFLFASTLFSQADNAYQMKLTADRRAARKRKLAKLARSVARGIGDGIAIAVTVLALTLLIGALVGAFVMLSIATHGMFPLILAIVVLIVISAPAARKRSVDYAAAAIEQSSATLLHAAPTMMSEEDFTMLEPLLRRDKRAPTKQIQNNAASAPVVPEDVMALNMQLSAEELKYAVRNAWASPASTAKVFQNVHTRQATRMMDQLQALSDQFLDGKQASWRPEIDFKKLNQQHRRKQNN